MKRILTLDSITMTMSLVVAVACTVSAAERNAMLAQAGQVSRMREKLDRGIVSLRREDGTVYVGWRLPAEDPANNTMGYCQTPMATRCLERP